MAGSDPESTFCHERWHSAQASSSLAKRSRAVAVGRVEAKRDRASSVRASYSAMIVWREAPMAAQK